MVKYYIPVEDGDGHVYLCENQNNSDVLSYLLGLDGDFLEEVHYNFIDSFKLLDNREYYIVLKDDLQSE